VNRGDTRRRRLSLRPDPVVTDGRGIDSSLCLKSCSSHVLQSIQNETIVSYSTLNATVFSMANVDSLRGTDVALVSWVTAVIMFFAVAIKLGTRMMVTKRFGFTIDEALILAAMVSSLVMLSFDVLF
jgi:hypothetical protein